MLPELFSLPFIHLSIKSYGFMMVLGFLLALAMARWRSRKLGEDPEMITNCALWALILGVLGARIFHVIHNWSHYGENPGQIVAIWSGGLEFLGGFILAVATLVVYFWIKKRPLFNVLDILAPSAMLGLAIGRLGCLLNGCCFGATCELPWALTFPAVNTLTQASLGGEKKTSLRYSPPYENQLYPDEDRDKKALIALPDDYYGYTDRQGRWYASPSASLYRDPKPPHMLSQTQLDALRRGEHPMQPVHPSQLYSFANGLLICLVLNLAFRRRKFPGQITALLFILYGATRFLLETIRADNPIEFTGLTISQNLGIAATIAGIILYVILSRKISLK